MMKGLIAATIFLCMVGCSKSVEAPKVAVAPTTVAGPTTELEKMGAVKMVPAPKAEQPVSVTPPAPVVVSAKKSSVKYVVTPKNAKKGALKKVSAKQGSVEDLAKQYGAFMKMRADCLRKIVDNKIAGDIKVGKIRDFGNVLQPEGLCGNKKFPTFDDAVKQLKAQSKKK